MTGHQVLHVILLWSTLCAAAGLAILVLSPLVFESPPPGLAKARPIVLGLVGVAVLSLLVEWLGVHGRSL
jgi:hypothetical protein